MFFSISIFLIIDVFPPLLEKNRATSPPESRTYPFSTYMLRQKQDIATLAYLVGFAYIEQSTSALMYRGNRSRKHVVVVVTLQ